MESKIQSKYPYHKLSYDSKGRFCSYWHQIDEIVNLQPNTVLEIGIGNGFTSNYLKLRGIKLVTLDIERELAPDIKASVLNLPFINLSFDLILCCQVLEHLPYEAFHSSLQEIHRVTNLYAVISVPDVTTIYRCNVELPKLGKIKRLIPHPFPKSSPHHFDGEHYWLIGKKGYPLKKIMNDISYAGFEIIKTYRIFEFYYHRFFILKKAVS